ncbi:hypothetical protein E6W36_08715 [Hankyongella ginsenosidimutans]|uniref:Uncharacterized protein n=1 Tax=Hankyongella ginsenosidimutans TaxID=1763828 RepID=A0A4D7C9I4_9SPHN|nr:hypothetical protein [Hankyongella ginsenosidimutans]QCI79593.1 hypothetical protein E6W36_08715 [Hankyongella ginsenosidimutans]
MLTDSGLLKFTKRAPLKAVKRWGYEVGWPDQRWLWKPALRPFRRVALYYDDDQGRPQHFDISLNHFRAEDTYAFIQAIARARPDLDWPKDFPANHQDNASVKRLTMAAVSCGGASCTARG